MFFDRLIGSNCLDIENLEEILISVVSMIIKLELLKTTSHSLDIESKLEK